MLTYIQGLPVFYFITYYSCKTTLPNTISPCPPKKQPHKKTKCIHSELYSILEAITVILGLSCQPRKESQDSK